jgi:hypothetical protein
MSRRLEKYASYLRKLYRASPKAKKVLLKSTKKDNEFVKCLCECAKNIIKGNVKLTTAQREKICRRKQSFRKLSLKKTPLKEKRRIVQSGGFLGALLGPIISILGGLFGSSSSS